MAEKEVSFCCDVVVEDSLELKQKFNNLESDYVDSKETTVTETAESRYLESVEIELNDGSELKVDVMSPDEEFRYHIQFRPEDGNSNFDRSEGFLSELHDILDMYDVKPHFMTVSSTVDDIESNLPSSFSLDTSDYGKEYLQVSKENKKFGFAVKDGRIEFYIRVEGYEYENFNDQKTRYWEELEEWMNS